MAAKSILDQTLKKLQLNVFVTNDENVNDRRRKLIEKINNLFEKIAVIRKSKSKKKSETNLKDEEYSKNILEKGN
jgi:hypothetical protein